MCNCVYILKFKSLVQRTQASQKGAYCLAHSDQLTGDDIHTAEVLWICSIQADSFSGELTYLRSKFQETLPPPLAQFGLFIDNLGLLRCRGRINNSQLDIASKSPSVYYLLTIPG